MIAFVLSLAWACWLIAFGIGTRTYVFWFAVIPSVLVLWSLAAPSTGRAFLN
jgi:hypothetical protein